MATGDRRPPGAGLAPGVQHSSSGALIDSRRSIFLRFLRFGALAWGGPAAQIAMIARECVDEERWMDRDEFARTLAVYQVLPGPEAHELCVHFGRLRGGRLGGLLAGLGFMLPGFLLMLGVAALYVHAGLDERFEEIFYGLQAAVAALVAMAVVRLGRSFIKGKALLALALAAFALTLAGANPLLVLIGAGVAHWAWRGAPGVRGGGSAGAVIWAGGLVGGSLAAELFIAGLETGLFSFGGAYTAVPLLDSIAVEGQGWLTREQFLDGIALGGILPAPLIIFATFVGFLAGGLGGALLMTVGVFLPAFVLPTLLHDRLAAAADDGRLQPLLRGVAAAVVGLVAAITIDIVGVAVVDVPSALLALAAFAVLWRWHAKRVVLFVVLGCGALGALLQLTLG